MYLLWAECLTWIIPFDADTIPWDRNYYPHYKDVKTEVQRDKEDSLSPLSKWRSWDLNPGLSGSRASCAWLLANQHVVLEPRASTLLGSIPNLLRICLSIPIWFMGILNCEKCHPRLACILVPCLCVCLPLGHYSLKGKDHHTFFTSLFLEHLLQSMAQ